MYKSVFYRMVSIVILVAFTLTTVCPASLAQVTPSTGILTLTPPTAPALLKGIKIDPANPFHFNFLAAPGNLPESASKEQEYNKLLKYFLASLTTSQDDMWVNLSPFESDRIVPEHFGQTEMGRDMLAQDFILKQLAASLLYPESTTGSRFWKDVHSEWARAYGTTDMPADIFQKIWIVPESATVFEKGNVAVVVECKLKVMLKKDYLAMAKTYGVDRGADQETMDETLEAAYRSVILPEIEKEVNNGETFTQLRQMFHSMVLASWFKKRLKQHLLSKAYADQNRKGGLELLDPGANDRIYQEYLQTIKKGVYNYIREEEDPLSGDIIPRKYFSGGVDSAQLPNVIKTTDAVSTLPLSGTLDELNVNLIERVPEELFKVRFAGTRLSRRPLTGRMLRVIRDGLREAGPGTESANELPEPIAKMFRDAGVQVRVVNGLMDTIAGVAAEQGARLPADLISHTEVIDGKKVVFVDDDVFYYFLKQRSEAWLTAWAKHELIRLEHPKMRETAIKQKAALPEIDDETVKALAETMESVGLKKRQINAILKLAAKDAADARAGIEVLEKAEERPLPESFLDARAALPITAVETGQEQPQPVDALTPGAVIAEVPPVITEQDQKKLAELERVLTTINNRAPPTVNSSRLNRAINSVLGVFLAGVTIYVTSLFWNGHTTEERRIASAIAVQKISETAASQFTSPSAVNALAATRELRELVSTNSTASRLTNLLRQAENEMDREKQDRLFAEIEEIAGAPDSGLPPGFDARRVAVLALGPQAAEPEQAPAEPETDTTAPTETTQTQQPDQPEQPEVSTVTVTQLEEFVEKAPEPAASEVPVVASADTTAAATATTAAAAPSETVPTSAVPENDLSPEADDVRAIELQTAFTELLVKAASETNKDRQNDMIKALVEKGRDPQLRLTRNSEKDIRRMIKDVAKQVQEDEARLKEADEILSALDANAALIGRVAKVNEGINQVRAQMSDHAMKRDLGGIDFNESYLALQIDGSPMAFPDPMAGEAHISVAGLTPEILGIRSGTARELSFFKDLLPTNS